MRDIENSVEVTSNGEVCECIKCIPGFIKSSDSKSCTPCKEVTNCKTYTGNGEDSCECILCEEKYELKEKECKPC